MSKSHNGVYKHFCFIKCDYFGGGKECSHPIIILLQTTNNLLLIHVYDKQVQNEHEHMYT